MTTRNPTWVAQNYRLYVDTGAPATTAIAAADTRGPVVKDSKFRLRWNAGDTNNANTANVGSWVLQYSQNGGAFTTITTSSSVVKSVTSDDSGNFADGTALSQVLSNIVGSTYQTTWDVADTNASIPSQTWADTYTEYESCLQLNSANVGDKITFRVLSPSSSTAVTFTNVPTVDVAAGPGVGSIAITGYAPSVLINPQPGVGSIAKTGYAPTPSVHVDVPKGTAAFTGLAPDVSHGYKGAGLGLLILGVNLEVSASPTISPPVGSITITGYGPPLLISPAQPGVGSATFTKYAPTPSIHVDVGKGSVAITGLAPNSLVGEKPTPGLGTLTATGYAPSLLINPQPGVGSATFTKYAPTPSVHVDVPKGTAAFTGLAPRPSVHIDVPKGTATFTGFAPSLGDSPTIVPPVGSITANGLAPAASVHIDVGIGSAAFTGYAPTVDVSGAGSTTIAVDIGSLTLTGLAPTVNVTGAAVGEFFTGGWRETFRREQLHLKRRSEQDKLAAEIAALEQHLREQGIPESEIVSRETSDLQRLKSLVAQYAQHPDLPNRVRRAIEYAQRARTEAAYILAERQIARLVEEEEFAVLMVLALDD